MEDMAKRTQDTAIQQQALEGKPEAIARDIKALDESSHALLEAAEAQQAAERGAEDALPQAEARHAQTYETLAPAREPRAGAVARAGTTGQHMLDMGAISGKTITDTHTRKAPRRRRKVQK